MEIYFTPMYEGLLEDKTTYHKIGVWWYLTHEIHEKNSWYIWEVEILAVKICSILSQAYVVGS